MGAGTYLIGAGTLALVVAAIGFAAVRARQWLVPGWSSAPARVVETVLGVSLVVVWCEAVGSVGAFHRLPVAAGLVAAGVGIGTWCGRARPCRACGVGVTVASPRVEVGAATIAVATVAAQWAGKIGFALSNGMTHPDTIAYHATYAAQFVQRGRLLDALDPTDPLHAFAGHTSELLHATLMLLVGRDLVNPLVNLAWAALGLTAAWSLGRRHGVGALCVLGVAVVLGLPTIGATQPGQASNDVAAAALLLAAVALFVEGALAPRPTAVAALAAGLALSTKVTAAAPVAVLTVAVVILAWRRRRLLVLGGAWVVPLALTGAFWFIRNVKVAHNPLPYYTIRLGFLTLTEVPQRRPGALVDLLVDWQVVTRLSPGLRTALGPLWPVVVIGACSVVAAVFLAPGALERIAAAAMAVGLVAYAFTPYTGDGFAYVFNVRYATPALLGAAALAALPLAARSARARLVWVFTAFAIGTADLFVAHHESVPSWPATAAVLAPVTAVAVVGVVWARARRVAVPGHRLLWAGGVIVVIIGIGWPVQRHFFEHRYRAAGLASDPLYAAFRNVRHAHVAYYGTAEPYPFTGAALDNRISNSAPATGRTSCRAWLRHLAGQDYVVLAHRPFAAPGPDARWLTSDPGVRRLVVDGQDQVLRVDRPLDERHCDQVVDDVAGQP